MRQHDGNLVINNDFSAGTIGQLPDFWHVRSPKEKLAPRFELAHDGSAKVLLISGNGDESCVGCMISSSFALTAGRAYRMKVQFRIDDAVNAYRNLIFAFYSNEYNNGIFQFTSTNGWMEGENRFYIPGEGELKGEVRIYFRLSGNGRAWVHKVTFEECEQIPSRNVKIACVQGTGYDTTSLGEWEKVLDKVGREHVDLVILPETFRSTDYHQSEPMDGPSAGLMSSKAKQYKMHVAGTFYHLDQSDGNVYNTGLVYDRNGELLGRYDKNHPYSPENLEGGIVPGSDISVFAADFGKIGMMICYDYWFTDVIELLALKGAEIILFPNAYYYQSIMPARACDNCVRIVTSSLAGPMGIWDTTGAEVRDPNADPTRHSNCKDPFHDVYTAEEAGVKILFATLDLSQSPSPHNWGGPMKSAPGGRRNRREQKDLLFQQIQSEIENG